jgi:Ca2+-binding RTX toxin-like protein
MPTIVVNTAADTIADDGKMSLREAVAQAGGMAGKVDIVFDTATFYVQGASSSVAISLQSTLTIAKGNIVIDGSLFYAGNAFGLKISGGGISTNAIEVAAGATVTLRDLTVEGSSNNSNLIKAKYGSDGHNGADGLTGVPNHLSNGPYADTGPGTGLSGGHGTDGQDAPNDAEAGHDAVGAIINRGTLTLERVDIQSFKTEGGAGGLGGAGGYAGAGGNGDNGTDADGWNSPSGIPGDGGDGGNAGAGARGGDGGTAVAGIYNAGTLTLRDVLFEGLAATGGNGGQGGTGRWGGHGGNAGYGSKLETLSVAYAGDGGNGSNGGNGGNGGAAASALFNVGTVIWDGVQPTVVGASLHGGLGGQGGDYGEKGVRGLANSYGTFGSANNDPHHGHDGQFAGEKGHVGANGGTNDFIGASTATGTTFSLNASREAVAEGGSDLDRLVYFNVAVLGSNTGTHSVKWTFVPGKNVSADDFDSPVETSGQITFSDGQTGKGFGLRVKNDGKSEGIESFTIKLSDPDGGVLGWSKDVTVYIIDGDGTGEAPTSIKLSDISLKENSKTNTTLGTLSTKDGDNGDQFTYELIKDAGGRYKIVGDKIKVADGSLLDYEQSHSNTIKVRSTDLFGNSVDKKFTIKLENVDPEKLKGNADANKLFGGAEADTINGGLGNDTLKGNGAADRFVFDSQLDATANVDHIVDFKHDLDKIALDKDIFKKLSGKVLSDDFFHAAATAHDKNDHILYQQKSGMLFYDADGKKPGADPVLFAVLDNHAKIDAGDFVIV